eukprot:CAMPEP_0172920858 /NCGR_PEP_ID=MMETSP1075-20121228/204844_1 /TAXON_ID=2916 /ORGANISM="Ceratium fusus, Strain PA161109" /LENGTH=418 /DNA_ID=CAMNT_0013780943 /DNA_START=122 /DNA_END=1378 /DNA_ORIENTATION=-
MRGIDFSHCRERSELEELWKTSSSAQVSGLQDESFAVLREGGRQCWVEFVDEGDALCHWEDGSDAMLPAADLLPLGTSASALQGAPRICEGGFEAARSHAFASSMLLVVALDANSSSTDKGAAALKATALQSLALASEELNALLNENSIFWRGGCSDLREPQWQQLAPQGAPCIAMVLPLAADAMKVLSVTEGSGCSVQALVEVFVAALEALQSHQEAAQARLVCEEALLRQEQDAEFQEALAMDRSRAEAEDRAKEVEAEERSNKMASEPNTSAESDLVNDATPKDAVKRTSQVAQEMEEDAQARAAKIRRLAADFLAAVPTPPTDGISARLVLRLPSGERVERTFGGEECLSRVRAWAACCPELPEARERVLHVPLNFDLAMAFPNRKLLADDDTKTLAELGLTPSAALFLIVRED